MILTTTRTHLFPIYIKTLSWTDCEDLKGYKKVHKNFFPFVIHLYQKVKIIVPFSLQDAAQCRVSLRRERVPSVTATGDKLRQP